MNRIAITLVALAFALPAFAEDNRSPTFNGNAHTLEPTVALTQAELQALLSAAAASAVAAPVLRRVNETFAPKPETKK